MNVVWETKGRWGGEGVQVFGGALGRRNTRHQEEEGGKRRGWKEGGG